VRTLPDGNGAGEERATCACQLEVPRARIRSVANDPDETAPHQWLKPGGEGGAIHREQARNGAHARRLWSIERREERELAMREIERAQRRIEAARERTRGALRVQTQALIANARRHRERHAASI